MATQNQGNNAGQSGSQEKVEIDVGNAHVTITEGSQAGKPAAAPTPEAIAPG